MTGFTLFKNSKTVKTLKIFYSGILTVGGSNSNGHLRTAEVFNPKSGQSCKIGEIPVATNRLSMCGTLVCGGEKSRKSCARFDGLGTFTTLSVTLTESRQNHLCWELPSKEVLLFGGDFGRSTTERVSADGTSSMADFNLPYDIRFVFKLMATNNLCN